MERNTPRASSVAFCYAGSRAPLRRRLAVDLSRHPEAQSIEVQPHDLETYDGSPAIEMTIPTNSLATQLQQIGLRSLPASLDDFLARATKARWSPRRILEQLVQAETHERSRRSLEHRVRRSGIKRSNPWPITMDWPPKIEREVIERALTRTSCRRPATSSWSEPTVWAKP